MGGMARCESASRPGGFYGYCCGTVLRQASRPAGSVTPRFQLPHLSQPTSSSASMLKSRPAPTFALPCADAAQLCLNLWRMNSRFAAAVRMPAPVWRTGNTILDQLPCRTRGRRRAMRDWRYAVDAALRSAGAGWLARAALALVALASFAVPLPAQDYPSRPVRIIVPFPAGGTADAMPRLIADWLSRKWGQPVVIENRTGAAGNIGAEAAFKADPD